MIPHSLEKRLRLGRVIPFIGAGVSRSVERPDGTPLFPSWIELLKSGVIWLDRERKGKEKSLVEAALSAKPVDFLGAAAHLRDGLGPLWFDFLHEQLSPSRREAAGDSLELARSVWKLGSKLLITTNYDRVLHWACPPAYRDDLVFWDIEAPAEQLQLLQGKRLTKPTVWHLHGQIENATNLILTPDSYTRFYASRGNQETSYRAARATLRSQLFSYSLLFIGFSFNDVSFGVELKKIIDDFKGSCGPYYVLAHKEEAENIRNQNLPVALIEFSEYGQPLLSLIRHLGSFKIPEPQIHGAETTILTAAVTSDPPGLGRFDIPKAKCPNERTYNISQKLEDCYHIKEDLIIEGKETTFIDEEILELRRQLREGGKLSAGDFLLENRFKLIEPMGKGGFAKVWKAFDRAKRELVAVKVLHGQYAEDRTRRERFFRGSRKMAKIHHQGIVKVIEEELFDGGHHFFVMEYVEGGDLRKATIEGSLSNEQILEIIGNVGYALQAAHREGLVHRDIKPSNILLDIDKIPKITDFDLVRAEDTTGGTRTGNLLGTVMYTAPEIMEKFGNASVTSDIYSLGMTAVFAFYGDDLPLDVLRDARRFISRLEVPPAVRQVLSKSVAWNSDDRFTSVSSFSSRLKKAFEGSESAAPDVNLLGSSEMTLADILGEPPTSKSSDANIDGIQGVAASNCTEGVLSIVKGKESGKRFSLAPSSSLVVGRGKGADVRIHDPAVSLRHCEVAFRNGLFVVRDLGSTNGTFINKKKSKESTLEQGDRIQVGATFLVFKYEAREELG